MAIASLILGIVAIITWWIPFTFGFLGILCGLLAVILGILGKRRLQEEGRSSGMAIGGLVLGVIGLVCGFGNAGVSVACARSCSEVLENPSVVLSEPVTEEDEEAGQEWAEQQAELLRQEMLAEENQANPTPGMPTQPLVPGTPPVPATPGMPAAPTPPVPVGGSTVALNIPVSAMFSPGLPEEADTGRAYMDYTFTVAAPGNYAITLISPNSTAYDPYLRLMQNGAELEHNDDGAGYPNSRITRMLTPGTYVIRVTSFRRGQIAAPAPFTLTVTNG